MDGRGKVQLRDVRENIQAVLADELLAKLDYVGRPLRKLDAVRLVELFALPKEGVPRKDGRRGDPDIAFRLWSLNEVDLPAAGHE